MADEEPLEIRPRRNNWDTPHLEPRKGTVTPEQAAIGRIRARESRKANTLQRKKRAENIRKGRGAFAKKYGGLNGALTPKQQMFVQEFAIDLDTKAAALRTGYANGSQAVRNPKVKLAIQRLQAKMTYQAELTVQKVLHELANIGFCNIGDLLEDDGTPKPISQLTRAQTAAISEVVVDQYMERGPAGITPVKRTRIKLMDKRQALVDLGKHMGMFVERKEFGRPGDFAALDSKKLEQALYDEYLALGVSAAKARALVAAASQPEGSQGEGAPGSEPD